MERRKLDPVTFSHVGLTVPNLEEALQFYKEVRRGYHIYGSK